MQQENPARPEFWQPRFHVVSDRRFRMEAVKMENVDARIRELRQRFIEIGTQERRE